MEDCPFIGSSISVTFNLELAHRIFMQASDVSEINHKIFSKTEFRFPGTYC